MMWQSFAGQPLPCGTELMHQEENFFKNVERTNQVNKHVAKFSKGIDKTCKGIYDLLPHYHEKDNAAKANRYPNMLMSPISGFCVMI